MPFFNKKRPPKEPSSPDPFIPLEEKGIKDGKLSETSYRSEWIENTFLDSEKEKEVVGRTFDFTVLKWITAGMFLLLAIMFSRVGWLQVVKGEHYSGMAEGNRIRVHDIPARRGIIYDRQERPLVRNKADFVLYLVPGDLPEETEKKEAIIEEITDIINSSSSISTSSAAEIVEAEEEITKEEIEEKLEDIDKHSSQAYQPLFLTNKLSYEQAMLLYLRSDSWPGVMLAEQDRREYIKKIAIEMPPKDPEEKDGEEEGGGEEEKEKKENFTVDSLSHILGYTGKINREELREYGGEYSPLDKVGKTGVEYFREQYLRGRKGEKRVEVDAAGKEKKMLARTDPREGRDLILSLDVALQAKAEEVLRRHISELDSSDKGAVVALDPSTGEVLALVSVPAFDNNLFARGISSSQYRELIDAGSNPLLNRALSGDYPPASTFKPVMAAASLQEGIINEHTSFESVGGLRTGEWFFPDWRSEGHGITDVKKAIAESVNTFFYYVGGGYEDFSGLGMERITEYASAFGLGEETGIDLPGETDGFLPDKEWKKEAFGESWYIGDTYHLSIGQGFLSATPIQVANYTASLANGGTLYRPFLLKKVIGSEGETEERSRPEVIREDLVADGHIETVRQGMRMAVVEGSCRRLYDLPVKAAGKTGTAQWSNEKEPHAWFTGFAPYRDPEIVLTVLIVEGGESEKTAVPAARDIMQWYFDREEQKDVE